jgi:hypothetical protein
MVDRMCRNRRRRFIENYEFSTTLIVRLSHELGDRRKADIALEGLRGWYLASLYADGRLIGMPSRVVDEAWHNMILFTGEYMWFCDRAFGRYLHHTPDLALAVSMNDLLAETLAIVEEHGLPMALFAADGEAGIEGGRVWSSPDLHRLRQAATTAREPRRARRSVAASFGGSGGGFFDIGGFLDGGGGSDGGGCGGGGCGGGG